MIAWVNARLHIICDGCYRRWRVEDAVDGRHLCDRCRQEPLP